MTDRPTILIIDDNESFSAALAKLLSGDYQVDTAAAGSSGLEKARRWRPQLILLDLKLPGMSGIDVLRKLKESGSDTVVVVMTAYGDVESAVQAMKLGAVDYVTKPFDSQKLKTDIRSLLALRQTPPSEFQKRSQIISQSPQMEQVWELARRFAPSDVTLLLQGESGTGKELFARAIHHMSKRRAEPFVPLDCATLPETLAESELFGHEKGAFTGAQQRKPGRFELADGGTLFLDEIGNLTAGMQMKLLRAIQEFEIHPLGSKQSKHLNLRIIAATNTDLREAVRQGGFREDLYYRLATVTIELPPLRDREGDVQMLCQHFVSVYNQRFGKSVSDIAEAALNVLKHYYWPGNVRELDNVMKSAVLLAEEEIQPHHLPPYLRASTDPELRETGDSVRLDFSVRLNLGQAVDLKRIAAQIAEQAEKEVILELLKRNSLNRAQLAKVLNVDLKTLRAKLKKFGVKHSLYVTHKSV